MLLRQQHTADATRYPRLTSQELREAFLIEGLFAPGEVALVQCVDLDRLICGSASPTGGEIELPSPPGLRSDYFCQRRELGVFNLGGPGRVEVDQQSFELAEKDTLYVGRGSRRVRFASASEASPARYYLLSFPAHAAHPTTLVKRESANRVELGSAADANRRTIHQAIHPGGVASCQLVMGWTELAGGSVWNTMPPHTHLRRCEVYLYFDLAEGQRVLHLMGEPSETRGLWVDGDQAVLSPAWSIHCGAGTGEYSFVWGMGGENQSFDDMDAVGIELLR